MILPHFLRTIENMCAFEVKLPRQKEEISVHQKQQMGASSDPKCEIAVNERREKEEAEQQAVGSWHKASFEQATGPPPRKKFKLDETREYVPEKSSVNNPCVDRSIAAIDCKAKTSSVQDSSCNDQSHYHEPTEKDIVFGKGRFIQNLAGNVRLRKLITSHFDQYESADSPQDKTLLAMRLVADIKESGGKFLKEDASAPGRYVEVGSITAREKIAATFHSHRRRSKQSKMEQVTTEDLKHKVFSTTSTEASLRSSSSTSLMGGEKAMMDRMLAFTSPSTLMALGADRQRKLFGSPLGVNTPSSLWLQHGLNMSPRRAFELSGDLTMISRTDVSSNTIPFQGSVAPVYDRVPVVEKCAPSAASREKTTLRKQMGNSKVGSALSARSMLEGMKLPAPGRNKNRVTLQSSSVSAGSNAYAKNSQAHIHVAPSCDASIKNPPRLSRAAPSQRISSQFIGSSSRRISPAHATHLDSRTASSFESSTKYTPHFSAEEALRTQLYREMGLPGF